MTSDVEFALKQQFVPLGSPSYDKEAAPLVILLQGPVGPFFKYLGKGLRANGFRTLKINFNMGDVLYTHGSGTLLFRDTPERWKAWFTEFLRGNRPKCIILFGDQRIYHRHAIAACNDNKIDVWCMEEGYIRPDYVTFERGGNNAASATSLSQANIADEEIDRAAEVPIKGSSFGVMGRAAAFYYISMSLGHFMVSNYVHHRNRGLLTEIFFWLRNLYRKWRRVISNAHAALNLLEHHDAKFFIVALQVHDDMNLVSHGNGWSMEMLIEATIRSFALHAAADELLLIKCHPLDRGHWTYDTIVSEMATLANVSDRVRLIDDSPLGLLLRHARGMVIVNSTSGILALRIGCPVFVLGEALYRRQGLVQFGDQAALDQFWVNPTVPDPATSRRFLSEMKLTTQVNGSLYQKEYFGITIKAMIKRISAGRM